jgi:hypothetical protein
VKVDDALVGATGLRYVWRGNLFRPFVEGGLWGSPSMNLTFTRTYANGAGTATGIGETTGSLGSAYVRGGMLYAPNPTNEIAFSGTYAHNWLSIGAYSEKTGASNPFPASFAAKTDQSDMVKATVEWTRSFTPRLDMTLSGSVGYVFDTHGVAASVAGIGGVIGAGHDFAFAEYGARVGWKLTSNLTADAFLVGTSGDGIGTHVQGGAGLRLKF